MKLTLRFTGLPFVFALSVLIFSACKKHNPVPSELTADATVIDRGSPAADGCGWEMQISATDSVYSVTNLPVAFQIANLPVRITYHKLSTRYYCSMVANNRGPGMTEIQLDAITKR